MIVDIGEDTKSYRVYLPKDRIVIITQYVRNVEALNKKQNENVQRLYLGEDSDEAEAESKTNDLSGPAGRGGACAS